jgi:hypothetical protein
MALLHCPKCDRDENPGAKFCSVCGGKLTPLMRVVIMPFVESGQEVGIDPRYQGLVEYEGALPSSLCIGCQMFISSDIDSLKLVSTQRDQYFTVTGKMLPALVKQRLDGLDFYQVPDTRSVDAIAEQAGDMPLELFLLIQEKLDPDFLFLPEVNCFFFRYPHPYGKDEISASGFAFVQLSAFLLENRENKIMSRGTGSGLAKFDLPPGVQITEDFSIDGNQQMQTLFNASDLAVTDLLTNMKMI